MKEEINIVAILKEKPGAKLYDLLRDKEVKLDHICNVGDEIIIICSDETNAKTKYFDYSERGTLRGYLDGLQILMPSKKMRDWSKFAWKKGDVIYSAKLKEYSVFNGFINDDYTWASCKYTVNTDKNSINHITLKTKETVDYEKVSDKKASEIISLIEEHHGGKLNLSTLRIEPEFKDGDIVFMKGIEAKLCANCIFILRGEYVGGERAFYYAFYNVDDNFVCAKYSDTRVHYSLRPATDSEKQQLFDALAKENKRWNAGTKQIEDIKKEHELKPFDRVLVRDGNREQWVAQLFSHIKKDAEYPYVCISDPYRQCIPYNEKTMHLLGTNDDYKEGGSDE